MGADGVALSRAEMLERLPHRKPFLFVDRVLSWDAPGRRLVAFANVVGDEPFFRGHFPDQPIMPGLLIVEAMGQAACLLASLLDEPNGPRRERYHLAAADAMRFRRPVRPGDAMTLRVECASIRRGFFRVRCHCDVDGEPAAEGVVTLARVSGERP